jgi:processive 1,2-diacylglycerol beta-glucosyltransferase
VYHAIENSNYAKANRVMQRALFNDIKHFQFDLIPLRTELRDTIESADNQTKKKRLLILSVSAGSGHVRAAEAILARAADESADIEAIHWDIMDYMPGWIRKMYTDWYIHLVHRYPQLWAELYRFTNKQQSDSLLQKLRRAVERWGAISLMQQIALFKPDAIICTHFLPAEIVARQRNRTNDICPVWIQVTDFDLHQMWIQNGIAGYFTGNDEIAFRLRTCGMMHTQIHITGIPVMPSFAQPLDRVRCATWAGINPKTITILLMGGGAGLGNLEDIAAQLLKLDSRVQLLALAGKNAKVLAALQTLSDQYPDRLIAYGFTHQVAQLMACADFVITKPGGLTTSECLAMGSPMILHAPIPGQEERNADYLVEQGVALKAVDAAMLEYRVRYLLDNPYVLAGMRRKAQCLGRPDAAKHVLDTVTKAIGV